jgi:NAD(P) transhydrogenase
MTDSNSSYVRAPAKDTYDLIVLGSGPGGQRAAVQAAKLGKSVLVIEKQRLGGSCLHMGTIPSKALREAALSTAPGTSSLQVVMARTHRVIEDECKIIELQLGRNLVEFISGIGSFVDANTILVKNAVGEFKARATNIVIAVGTRPRRPAEIPFDGQVVFDSDTLMGLEHQPRSLLVLGAGVIGCEYASIFARTGVKVTLVESREGILPSIDQELVTALMTQFEETGIQVRVSTTFRDLKLGEVDGRPGASLVLIKNGHEERCEFEAVLYCLGRTGNYEDLNLAAVGLAVDERGSLAVNKNYQTSVSNIYAVGDIIGAPALAASSSEQGRLAVLHALTGAKAEFPDTFPYGIYTIPEISSVGFMESQLDKRKIKYVVGKAQYSELARGKMIADDHGFLKLVIHAKTRRLVGIHVIGPSATELVHIGQVAMSFGATVDFFLENVFNYPTLAEAYKVAAFNAVNQLK